MSVDELGDHLRAHWPEIRSRLLAGSYTPQPVRRVEIPKASGGVRRLGVPTVIANCTSPPTSRRGGLSSPTRFIRYEVGGFRS